MLSIALLAPLARVAPRRLAWLVLVVCGLVVAALPSNAEEPASALAAGLVDEVRSLALDKAAAPAAARVEVVVGQLDPRLHLAPCERIEPYLPANVRLWGKSRIGLRCTQGRTAWNVYLPITVKVFGTALTATAAVSAGSVLTAADLVAAEIDLAEDHSSPVTRTELAVGRTLARALQAGQGLRQSHLKARQWFAAGETVTVLAQGDGFSVAGEAQALNPGIEGQPVRVRTESGRVLTGQPVGDRRVELSL